MKVTLFKDMRAEGWRSMDRYAYSLYRDLSKMCLERTSCQVSLFSTEPPLMYSKVKMFWKNVVYPFMAKGHAGDVNHILDHSYAHLLTVLNPAVSVVTCHDLIPLFFEKDPILRSRFKETVENLKSAARIIVGSQSAREDLVNVLNIDEEKIVVVHLGVDQVFRFCSSTEEKQKVKSKYGIPDGRIVLSHGNDLAYKNVEGILKTFMVVLQTCKDAYLVRVGPLNNNLRKLANDLGIEGRIYEIHNPDDYDLSVIYNLSDVYFCPSFKEGFGLPVLQSLACGTPVVISENTSLQEITGDLGYAVNPNDIESMAAVIIDILKDASLKDAKRDLYIKRASMFRWENTAEETFNVYESLNR